MDLVVAGTAFLRLGPCAVVGFYFIGEPQFFAAGGKWPGRHHDDVRRLFWLIGFRIANDIRDRDQADDLTPLSGAGIANYVADRKYRDFFLQKNSS